MSHSNEQALDPVAAFLANGGKIQEVAEGVRTADERELYAKASGRDELADRYTDRSMRDAENQVGLEQYHPYYRH